MKIEDLLQKVSLINMMNGALFKNKNGKLYVITRRSTLFQLV